MHTRDARVAQKLLKLLLNPSLQDVDCVMLFDVIHLDCNENPKNQIKNVSLVKLTY